MAVRLLRSGNWPAACHIGRSAALPANHRCAVGLQPFPREEFRQLKLILHSELRRRAASRRALPYPSSFIFRECTTLNFHDATVTILKVYGTVPRPLASYGVKFLFCILLLPFFRE